MMKRVLYLAVGLAAAVACAESSTAPTVSMGPSYSTFEGDPPPPPLDTQAVATTSDEQQYFINSTYFINKAETVAWVAFANEQTSGVTASPEARLMYNFNKGLLSGTGTLAFATRTVDLTTAELSAPGSATFNESCVPPKYDRDIAMYRYESGACANLTFDATVYSPARDGTVVPTKETIRLAVGIAPRQ